jgi:malate synthase
MAAQVPSRKDPVAAAAAIEAVRRDKDREVAVGHDGTWVAHPDLVPVAMEAWESRLGLRVEQLWNVPSGDVLDLSAVATAPAGPRTEVGLRELVRSSLKYVSSWLDGNGCVAIDGKMEDAATAEVSRSMLWQWVARRAVLDDGRVVTVDLIDAVVRGETAALVAEGWTPRPEAVDLLVRSVISPAISEFMIGDAYEILTKSKF